MQDYSWVIYIATGAWVTLKFSILSIIIGLTIGSLLAAGSLSSSMLLRAFTRAYVSIIRGTPLLLQLTIIHYGLPKLLGYTSSAFVSGVAAFSINSAAYVTEIIRSGILSIDRGQFEAAKSLSIPYSAMMWDIILPQAYKNMLPALVNEVVNLIKESAIISVIGEADLLKRASNVASQQYNYFAPMMVAALCYYVLVLILSFFAKKLEKHLHAKY